MIIKKIVIYGYGQWIDTEFDVQAPFHLFFGENEAGKSTLMSFIHSIFFGFPTRHSSSSRYEPKESSRYGGKIIIQDKRFGEVSIERVLGKVTGDVVVQFEDGTTGDETVLSTLFHGKSKSFYDSIYSFDLKGIEDIQELNEEQFNRFFLSIGALGHEKYLKQADYYHSQAGKLFKPMGRKPIINQIQMKLKEKKHVLDSAKENNESYVKLIEDDLAKQDQLKNMESKLEKTTEELNNLNELSKYKETIEEIQTIKNRLEELPDLNLPEEGLYQLKQFYSDIETHQQKINDLQDKQKTLQQQYKPSKELVMYQQNEEELTVFEKNMDVWEDKVQDLQLKRKDLSNIKQMITETKIREDISLADPLPQTLIPGDKEYLKNTHNRILELDNKITALEENEKALLYRININDDMIDNIEAQLLPLTRFNELTELDKKTSDTDNQKNTKSFIIPLTVTLTVLISLYFYTFNPLYSFGLITLSLILFYFSFRTDKNGSDRFSQEQRNLLYQQKNLRNQWKELLAANDDYQSNKEETVMKLGNIKNTKRSIDEDFEYWKQKHNYSDNITIYSVLDKLEIYEGLRELLEEESALTHHTESTLRDLNKRLNSFEHLFTRTFIAEDVVEKFKEAKSIFREIKREQRELKEYIKETDAVQHEINYYVQKVNEIKRSKRRFFESLNTTNQEEVYSLYTTQKEKNDKETRLSLLVEKLPVRDEPHLKVQLNRLDEKMMKLKIQQQLYTTEQKDIMKEMMEIEMQIKRLEDGGTYTELLQAYENEKSYYQEVVNEWSILKSAAGIIEKTLHHAKEDKLPHTLSIAESFFSYLTSEKYQQIIFDEDNLFVIDNNGNKWSSEDLSRGTVEPLYIALRLAFIKATKDSIQFPILIDDPFVNLDSLRVKKMYELLTSFDKDIQLIYFSFDQRIHSFIEDDNCVYLKKGRLGEMSYEKNI
ncbi:AAA family ATPase [Alkalibacterium sp. f15]|uniref:AAA family ATPase n=1 Tax=Alkalibacterium sp. f15 TaxID=3414029 RepID=UPI003BF8ADE8